MMAPVDGSRLTADEGACDPAGRRPRAAGPLRSKRLTSPARPESMFERLIGAPERDDILLADAARVFASRAADDVRRLRADQPHPLAGELLETIDIDPFALQQLAFQLAAERVLADAAVGRNDAMAGDDERHDVARH